MTVNEKLVDFELITKALHTSFETIKRDGENSSSLIQLKDAEKNLYQALSFYLQKENGKNS
ncbi:hypothetical protein [Bacillus sp. CECT 9360]|uniref:hypothetical protein n=1 Tax=Bacillus sp. CECT 9360 TaxID=2845821 RepID=UPI001E30D2EC|nr:hypothetical protein [Bacillus sp. CECT 9360]CAH0345478.1 hypothetical protein BCI9360_01764 [Bacillus sp. CECT 9360]